MKYYLFIKKDLKPTTREVLNSLVGEIENITFVDMNSLGDNKFTRLFWVNSLGDNIVPRLFYETKNIMVLFFFFFETKYNGS